jgi:hypothetical protein
MQVLRFASIYKEAAFSADAHANLHRWAVGIVDQAFKKVMGRTPTSAERQIVMAVSDLESNYGKGWKEGQGAGSHNWGAVQTKDKSTPQFSHKDSSAQGSYTTGFRAYTDDVAGAADVVNLLFKGGNKQHMPDPSNAYRALGKTINGPSRGELIEQAAQQGDTDAFSRAMWYTSYFEGVATDFTDRIKTHAQGIQSRVNSIASALGEAPAWNLKSPGNFLPVTNDTIILKQISGMSQKAMPQSYINAPLAQTQQKPIESTLPPKDDQIENLTTLDNSLWFQ